MDYKNAVKALQIGKKEGKKFNTTTISRKAWCI